MKLLTIAIPAYNASKYLPIYFRKSYLKNDDVSYLIVDDGSKDNTLQIANKIKEEYKNVDVIHQDNKGFGGAYNTIFNNAKSKYLYILDADDYINTDSLKEILTTMKNNEAENVDIFLARFVYERPNNELALDPLDKYMAKNKVLRIEDIKQFPQTDFVMNHNVIIKTKMLKDYPIALPGCHYCDNLFIAYIFMYSKSFYLIDKILCHYRIGLPSQSVSTISMSKNALHHLKTMLATYQYINKNKLISLSKYRQKHVLHYVFIVTMCATFSSYLLKNKENALNYKKYLKEIKKENYYLYSKMFHKYFIWKLIVSDFMMYRIIKIGVYITRKKFAWQY